MWPYSTVVVPIIVHNIVGSAHVLCIQARNWQLHNGYCSLTILLCIFWDIDLVRNNARVGSEIAVQLAQIWQTSRRTVSDDAAKDGGSTNTRSGRSHKPSGRGWGYRANGGGGRSHMTTGWGLKEGIPPPDNRQPVIIGGSILDLTAKIRSPKVMVSMINSIKLVLCINVFLRMRALIRAVWCIHLEVWPEM